jgi:hypothetical protein
MSAMSDLHADILAVVAAAETGTDGFRWIWVPDRCGTPGTEIRLLCRSTYMGNRAVILADWYLTDAGRLHPMLRTVAGAITRDGDSVRVRSTMGRDDEICTVSDALGVFA